MPAGRVRDMKKLSRSAGLNEENPYIPVPFIIELSDDEESSADDESEHGLELGSREQEGTSSKTASSAAGTQKSISTARHSSVLEGLVAEYAAEVQMYEMQRRMAKKAGVLRSIHKPSEPDPQLLLDYLYHNVLTVQDVETLTIWECNRAPFTIMNKMASSISYHYGQGSISEEDLDSMLQHLVSRGDITPQSCKAWESVYHKVQKKISVVRGRMGIYFPTELPDRTDFDDWDTTSRPVPPDLTSAWQGLKAEVVQDSQPTSAQCSEIGKYDSPSQCLELSEAEDALFELAALYGSKPTVRITHPGLKCQLTPAPKVDAAVRNAEKKMTKSTTTPDWLFNWNKKVPLVVRLPGSEPVEVTYWKRKAKKPKATGWDSKAEHKQPKLVKKG